MTYDVSFLYFLMTYLFLLTSSFGSLKKMTVGSADSNLMVGTR